MKIKRLTTENFRNLQIKSEDLAPAVNIVFGENGAGKTSLLEAVTILGNLRSFRTTNLRRVVRHGEDSFRLFGEVGSDDHTRRLEQIVDVGPPVRRRLFVDSHEVTVETYLQVFPVFSITGSDRELIRGGPEGRRALLDRFLFLLGSSHLGDIRLYRRALKQRNAALRSGASDTELETWEASLAAAGARVVTARTAGAQTLEKRFSEVLGALAGEDGFPIAVEYRGESWLGARNEPKKVEETYFQRYNETRTRDRLMGFTVDGPHRHDLSLRTDGRGVRHVLSTGQTKVVAAALRLATLAQVEKERHEHFPVVVDDVDAELDESALARLIDYLGSKRQLFLSSTSEKVATAAGPGSHRLWIVDGNSVSVRQEANFNE